ncbi:MAG: hypothetical protein AB7P17_03910 [Nitrospirales bacterium]|nr:hypothetical protein [Nitrospirales bacterium]
MAALAGCRSGGELQPVGTSQCGLFGETLDWSQRIQVLNQISLAFTQKCDQAIVQYAGRAQENFRHKTFSVSKETANVFLFDGALTEYVLESNERAYLSVLLAASYFRMGYPSEAKVELRRLDHELFAPLYNFGEDPVNLVLSAVLWEVLGEPGDARTDWYRVAEPLTSSLLTVDPVLREFAREQVKRLDQGQGSIPSWQVYGVGRFPEVDWELKLFGSKNGYYAIKPKQAFDPACLSGTGIRIPTESWFAKIAHRHDHAYHPLLNIQSWIRLPIAVIYGLVPFSMGAGIAVGGCAGAVSLGEKGSGDLCALSIFGGVQLMQMAPTFFQNTIRPDLRHWNLIPASFIITQAAVLESESCSTDQARVHNIVAPPHQSKPLSTMRPVPLLPSVPLP